MRRGLLISVALTPLLLLCGCNDDDKPPVAGVDKVTFTEENRTCWKKITLSFEDEVTTPSYYRAALLKGGVYYKVGFPAYFTSPKGYNLWTSITVTEDDQLPAGDYTLVVGRFSSNRIDTNDLWVPASSASASLTVNIPDYQPMCGPYVGCTLETKYAYLKKYVPDATGASAQIRIRYGNLCGGGDQVALAASLAWTGVVATCSYNVWGMIWAQVGYGQIRKPQYAFVWRAPLRYSYVEIPGAGRDRQLWKEYIEPNQDYAVEYECQLNPSTGIWYFRKNGQFFMLDEVKAEPLWVGQYGTRVDWCTEIYNIEDDMMGTSDYPCDFTDCKMSRSSGALIGIEVDGTDKVDVSDQNLSEWYIERPTANSITIWDVQPR